MNKPQKTLSAAELSAKMDALASKIGQVNARLRAITETYDADKPDKAALAEASMARDEAAMLRERFTLLDEQHRSALADEAEADRVAAIEATAAERAALGHASRALGEYDARLDKLARSFLETLAARREEGKALAEKAVEIIDSLHPLPPPEPVRQDGAFTPEFVRVSAAQQRRGDDYTRVLSYFRGGTNLAQAVASLVDQLVAAAGRMEMQPYIIVNGFHGFQGENDGHSFTAAGKRSAAQVEAWLKRVPPVKAS